jgi:hypothetical protein
VKSKAGSRLFAAASRAVRTALRARGAPAIITVDNGSECYARLTDSWAYGRGVRLEFSRPGQYRVPFSHKVLFNHLHQVATFDVLGGRAGQQALGIHVRLATELVNALCEQIQVLLFFLRMLGEFL